MIKITLIVLIVAGALGLWQAYPPQEDVSHVELTSTTNMLQNPTSQASIAPIPESTPPAAAVPTLRPQQKTPFLVKPPHFLITGIFRDTDEPSQSFAIIETMPGKSVTARIGKRLPDGFQVQAIEQHYVSVEKGDTLFKLSLKHSPNKNNTDNNKSNRSANTLSPIAHSPYNEPNQRPSQAQNRTRSRQNANYSRQYSTPAPTTTANTAESVGTLPVFISSYATPPTSTPSELISEPLNIWVRKEKNEPATVTQQEEETQSSDELPSFMHAQATGGYELPSFMVGGETEALFENIPSYMRSNLN